MTLKDYAASKKISYEAVRKQVNRYRDELGEHVFTDGRQQFLDAAAIEFLDERRMKNPIVQEQSSKNERIEELEVNYQNLLIKVAEQSDKIAKLMEWKAENAIAIASANQNQLMLEEKSKEIGSLKDELKDANKKVEELYNEKDAEVKRAEARAKLEVANVYRQKLEAMEKELEAERNRKLTLKERLFGKRIVKK